VSLSSLLDELDDSFGVSVGCGVGESVRTAPTSIVPVTGSSVLPAGTEYVDCGSADLVRRGVGDAVAVRVGVADGVAFGVLVGVGGGGVGMWHDRSVGAHVGLGVGDTVSDGVGVAVGLGDSAAAVPDGTRKASGTRAAAATAKRARRLGADVGTGRW
jgi:hypothetical protein